MARKERRPVRPLVERGALHPRGFTLIELTVVLIVAGILIVTFMPRLPTTESTTIKSRADQLASDIRYVQTLSMTRGGRYCLVATATSYELRSTDASSNCLATQEPHPAGLTQPIVLCTSNCLSFTNFSGTVEFDGLGMPYSAPTTSISSTAVITFTDGGASKTISISPTTGRVIVQ